MKKPFMQRRDFLKTAALGTAALAGGVLPSAPAATGFKFNYITASSMYGCMKLEEILPEITKTGTNLIDIWPKIHADQREQIEEMGHEKYAALLKQHGVKMGMITQFKLGPMKLQSEMPFLKKFGGNLLVCGSRGTKETDGAKIKADLKSFLESMKPHAAAAGEHGIMIGIENHSNAILNTPDSMRWFADLNKEPQLGVALAPYHLPQDPEVIASLIEHIGPQLFLFYGWEHGKGSAGTLPKADQNYQLAGRGTLDFVPLVRALKKINFRHYTEPFMHASPRGTAIADTPAAVTAEINRSREYLEACLKKA